MITENLYKDVLCNPIAEKSNKLYIVSGYASATFARRHIIKSLEINPDIEVNLIIGMPGAEKDHLAFLSLHEEFPGRFKGYYLQEKPQVHCKLYSWYNDDRPVLGFGGSGNYSQYGFFSDLQLNQFSNEDPAKIKDLFDDLLSKSKYIPDSIVQIPEGHPETDIKTNVNPGSIYWDIADVRVTISFLDRKGTLPPKSGLNWGQRKAMSKNKKGKITHRLRDPNEAYLSIKKTARKIGFLPEQAFTFSLITDDGESMDCVVAQAGRKSVETTYDNKILGKYFRKRLGVPEGAFLTIADLDRYGRTDFTIEKINDETFLLDFSVKKSKKKPPN